MGVGAALLFGVLVAGCGLLERLETQDGDPGFGALQWVSQGELAGERNSNEFLGSDKQTIMQAGFRKSHDVILAPGDEVEVKFYYTPELDVRQVVRPDGNLSLLLIGEVKAEGKTPGLLTDELVRRYRPHLKEPHVAVIVRSLYNRRVYVSGQVTNPGVFEMPARMTLMEAVMGAGGFSPMEADIKHVIVIRQKGGIRCACKIDMGPSLDDTRKLINLLKKDYDCIVLDLPAVNEAGYSARLASLCDNISLIVDAEHSHREVVKQAKKKLTQLNANVLGVVLNKRRFPIPEWIYRALS